MKIRKFLNNIAQYTPQSIVLFSVLTSNVIMPTVAIAEEISDLQSTITHIEEEIPIDESEDILEEGISTSIYEEEDLEPEVESEVADELKEEVEVEEKVPVKEVEEIPAEEVKKPEVEKTIKKVWNTDANIVTTVQPIVINRRYVSPQNDNVTVTFTKLPDNPGYLNIEEITLTDKEVVATNAISRIAYDITTDMKDGTFEYDLTLPNYEDGVRVLYAENRSLLLNRGQEVNNTIVNENGNVKIEGLNHFTIFAVVSPDETVSYSSVDNPNNAWVSDNAYATFNSWSNSAVYGFPDLGIPSGANIEGIEVLVEGKTTGRDLNISLWNQSNSSPDTYTSTKTANLSGSESIVTVGSSSDKWGKSWIDADFNNDFKIKVDGKYNFSGGIASLDHIQVKVAYSIPLTPPTLTNDPSDPVALTSVGGVWTSIDGGSGHTGINTNEIRWGTPAGSQKSGLRFTNSGLQSFDTGETFYLGMLTHMNWGTNLGTAASGATLQITLNFDRPNIPDVVLDYDFDIEETLNSAGNCMSYQISNTPCDDKITFPNSYGTKVFTIGDVQYTLVIDGFVNAYPSGNAMSAFITEEEKENSAFLIGHLSSILVEKPEIRLTKKTNNQDITSAPGENLYIGDTVEWKYIIQNSGNVDLTNVSITDNPSTDIDCDSITPGFQNSGLALASGETVTCTASGTVSAGQYSNKATVVGTHSSGTVTANDTSWYAGINKSHLIVQKTTVPASDSTPFDIAISTVNGTIFEDVNGSISDSTDYDYTVSAGTYSITETVPTGWQKTGDTCQDVVVGIGETKYCTITNTKDTGTLVVKKIVKNNYGGTLTPSNFSFKINGGNNISFDDGGQNDIEINPGTYSIVENSKTGYQATYDNCSNIQIDSGETETCTITNSDIQPKLTVTKVVVGSDKPVSHFPLSVDSTSVVSGEENGFDAGTYTVSETTDDDYNSEITGNCAPDGSITLAVGDIKACTITNTRKTGSVQFIKDVTVGNDDPTNWTFTVSQGETTIGTYNHQDNISLDTGTYTVVENGLSTYFLDSIGGTACTGTALSGVATLTVTEDGGTCIFGNSKRPTITIKKVVVPSDSTDTFDFTVSNTLEYSNQTTLGHNQLHIFTDLLPDTYTITEDYNSDYSTSISCLYNGSLEASILPTSFTKALSAGDTLDCTFTNTKYVPIIKVAKSSTTSEITTAGQVVPYTFTVTNEGNQTLTGITVTDGNCDDAPSYISGDTNTDSNLQTSETWVYSCNHTVTQDEIDTGGDLSNTVKANSNESPEDSDTKDIPINQNPSMTVEKSSTTTELSSPQTVTYSYLVTNTGNVTLTGITLEDDNDEDDMSCPSTTLAVGDDMTCSATHTFIQDELNTGGTLDNEVSADSDQTEPVKDNLSIPITQNKALTIEKNATPSTYNEIGDVISYSFKVKNTGNVTLYGITVEDDIATDESCPDTSGGLAPQSEITCSASYIITETDLDNLSVTNVASAHGYFGEAIVESPTDTETVNSIAGKIITEKYINEELLPEGFSQSFEFNPSWSESFELTNGETEESGWLAPGTYSVFEQSIDGWYLSDTYCESLREEKQEEIFPTQTDTIDNIVLQNNEIVTCYFYNSIVEPQLSIFKSNDTGGADMLPGDIVTYTITVSAPNEEEDGGKYLLKKVKVMDIIPEGFEYILGSATGALNIPEYKDNKPALWELGDMTEGDTKALTYQVRISDTQDPGIYKDIAYTYADSLLVVEDVLGYSTINPETPFVGTEVAVVDQPELDEGEVLGAATIIELPRTGANSYLTLGALITMIIGSLLLLINPKRKLGNLLITGILLFTIFSIFTPKPTYALDTQVNVQIEEPKSPTDKTSFSIGYVSLAIPSTTELEIQCYEEIYGLFGPVHTTKSGSCIVDDSIISGSGTYTFYVTAQEVGQPSTKVESEKVTIVVDLDKPEALTDYDKDEGTCSYTLTFKTANDSRTSKVQIFRSDKQPFTANNETLIKEMPVNPNKEYTYTDNNLPSCEKEYYYALRAVDNLNNTSPFTTDDIVTVVEVETTPVQTATGDTTGQGEVAGETQDGTGAGEEVTDEDKDENGEVIGEETESNGEEQEENGTEKEKTFWQKYWYVILSAGVILTLFVGYTYVKRKE